MTVRRAVRGGLALLGAGVLLLAGQLPALASASPAARGVAAGPGAADPGPQVRPVGGSFAGVPFQVGSTLSDSTPQATLPRTFRWTQSDPDGICRRNHVTLDGDTVTHPQLSAGATSVGFTTSLSLAPPDGGEQFEFLDMDTYDCLGNKSHYFQDTWTNLKQENAFTYSAGWQTHACACWSGGGEVASTRAGASATWTNTDEQFNAFALIGTKGPGRGKAAVFFDGRRVATVDNESSGPLNRVVVWQTTLRSAGTHTIKYVALSDARVEIDAVVGAGGFGSTG